MQAVMGLDIGTSAVKAVLVEARGGRPLAEASSPLRLSTPHPGWAEQDPQDWWDALRTAGRKALSKSRLRPSQVLAVGLSGQMHSSVFLDAQGKVIRPALLWCDGRTTAECRDIEATLGKDLARVTGNPALEGFTLPKVLWLRRHEPQAFRRLAKVLLPKDYIRYRLSGELLSEPSDASATLMFDLRLRAFSPRILTALKLSPGLVPGLGRSEGVCGRLNREGARALGLAEGTPIAGGGADNACGALAVGLAAPGDAVASWGSSGTVLSVTRAPRSDRALRVHAFCHAAEGLYYSMGVTLSAGASVAWYGRELARDLKAPREPELNREAAAVAPGAEGLSFLPYLQGERTPHRDASARGALVGLSLAHTRAHVSRAVIEGVAFALKDSLEILRKDLGLPLRRVLLTGGGARSPWLRKLQSEVYGLPVAMPLGEPGPAQGAALLAACAAGAHRDVASACRAWVKLGPTERPGAREIKAYRAPYARFQSLYPALRGRFQG